MNHFIPVSNGILTPEHRRALGGGIWEFLWCLDKITKIDRNGNGVLLGGRPIQIKEIAEQLGASEDTVSRNIHRLSPDYLALKRTPYGVLILVMKAKKRFGKNAVSLDSDTAKVREPETADLRRETADLRSDTAKVRDLIKTEKDREKTEQSSAERGDAPLVTKIIKAFEEVDPKNKTYYGNKTQRAACSFLIEEYGLEKVMAVIALLPKTNKQPYFPTINSPNDLKEKWAKLRDTLQRKKTEQLSTGRGLA